MKRGKLFARILLISMALLVIMPAIPAEAQRRGDPLTGQGFLKGKKVKQKKHKKEKKKLFVRDKAGKAKREQEQKLQAREERSARESQKLRDHHFGMQTATTQARMKDNKKRTDESYKTKRQKIKKDSRKPRNHRKLK